MTRVAVKFGVFAAVCLAITAWLAMTIGNIRLFESTYEVRATFDDVTGLIVDDNVKVAGVVVGKVTKIEIDRGRADVTFTVNDHVRLPSDSTAAIRWRNLIGQRYLYVYPGTAATVLEPGARLERTISVVDLGELFNRLGPIVAAIDPAQVNDFLDTVTLALEGNEDQVRATLADLATLASTLGERDAALGRLVGNLDTVAGTIAQRDRQIRTVLDNLVEITSAFSDNTGVVEAALDELGPFSERLATLLAGNRGEIDRSLLHLVAVLDVVEGRLGPLEQAVAGLDTASAAVFRAGRHGEWLNQVIPCFELGPPESEPPACAYGEDGAPAGVPPAGVRTQVDAVRHLMGLDLLGGRR